MDCSIFPLMTPHSSVLGEGGLEKSTASFVQQSDTL